MMFDQERMDELKESFSHEVSELLSELEQVLLEMEHQPQDETLIARAFRALHSIKGSGAMFGFDRMSEFVHEIESVFDRLRKGQLAVSHDLIDLTLRSRDELERMLAEGADRTGPLSPSCVSILAGFRAIAEKREEHEDREQRTRYHIRFTPSPDILRRGTDPAMLLDELRGLGPCTVTADTGRIPDLDAIVPDECYLSWDIELETIEPRSRIDAVFEFVADESELSIDRIDDAPQASVSGTPTAAAAPAATTPVSPSEAIRTIRVPAERLDSLVDLVGELVTVQARLNGLAATSDDSGLEAIAEEIERLTDELRDNAMTLRMVPIRTSFAPVRRLVRDLSAHLGKQVELVTSGEETELDKTVIERMADPLMHIIRNSIDHGIETVEERRAAGKSDNGTLHLRAAHEGATVVVSVADDGKGLDAVRIREKAIERGLIDATAELTEREMYNLIFLPGFSTSSRVTELSGRGVGMDVVRQTVESLGGTVEVASVPGAGTTIAMRLPLTLAIIAGLLVRVDDQRYVLPLTSVQELSEFSRERVGGSEALRLVELRGSQIPLVDLRRVFDENALPIDDGYIVVVDWNGSSVGLQVSDVEGQHQTVIKSLRALPDRVDGVSGATILGDGSVALILDVPKLIADVRPAFSATEAGVR